MVVMCDELPETKAKGLAEILSSGGHIGIEVTISADGTGALSLVAVCSNETRLIVSTILAIGGPPRREK